MAKGKIDPIKLVRKSSNSKKFDKLDFEELNIKKDDFSIDDLKNNKKNESKFLKLKSVLDSVSSCQISDASNLVSGRSGVISGLKAMNRNKVYGRIVTAKTNCDDWGTSVLAMNAAEEGDVLFIYCYGKPASVWGELASTSSKESGIAGTILYGYSRDMDAIIDLDYPVYALDFLPNAGKPLGLGQINIDIEIGNQIIRPGDFIFGDESGVVLVPQELFVDIIMETIKIKIKENNIVNQLKSGKTLAQIVGFDE